MKKNNYSNKIFFYTHGGSYNHGCEAIVRGSYEILKDIGDITLFSLRVKDEEKFGISKIVNVLPQNSYSEGISFRRVRALVCRDILKNNRLYSKILYSPIINFANKKDIAISIGGDMYCYDNYDWINNINDELKKKGVELILWGCSIEPSALDDSLIKNLAKYALICCRESITYNALKEKKIENIRIFPDPAFALPIQKMDRYEYFFKNKVIGINISPLIEHITGNTKAIENVIKLLDYILKSTQYNIALVPHVNGDIEADQDYEYMKERILSKYKNNSRILLIEKDLNCKQLKYIISRCFLIVASRTHASIAAYSMCVPTLVLGYSVKAKGIAKDIFGTYENYVLSAQSLQKEDELLNGFKWICNNENEIRTYLQKNMPDYIKEVLDAKNEIRKLMQK